MYDNLREKIKNIAHLKDKEYTTDHEMFLARWKEEYKLKDTIIVEGVQRTMDKIGKFSPKYTDVILKNWSTNNVNNYQDIVALDKEYSESKKKSYKNKEYTKKEKTAEKPVEKKSGNVVKFRKLTKTAKAPTFGSIGAAGADLYADIQFDISIPEGKTILIDTGIAVEIPKGYVGLLVGRSGLATKRGLAPANKIGIIDSDYRGSIKVACHNHDKMDDTISSIDYAADHTIHVGERIAQLIIVPYYQAVYEEVEELSSTERGEGGFGSTGTK